MKPFLMRFKEAVPAVDPELQDLDFKYDDLQQINITDSGELLWRATKPYTNCYTAAHYVPGHYTPKNKWVSGKQVSSKTDRRSGK